MTYVVVCVFSFVFQLLSIKPPRNLISLNSTSILHLEVYTILPVFPRTVVCSLSSSLHTGLHPHIISLPFQLPRPQPSLLPGAAPTLLRPPPLRRRLRLPLPPAPPPPPPRHLLQPPPPPRPRPTRRPSPPPLALPPPQPQPLPPPSADRRPVSAPPRTPPRLRLPRVRLLRRAVRRLAEGGPGPRGDRQLQPTAGAGRFTGDGDGARRRRRDGQVRPDGGAGTDGAVPREHVRVGAARREPDAAMRGESEGGKEEARDVGKDVHNEDISKCCPSVRPCMYLLTVFCT